MPVFLISSFKTTAWTLSWKRRRKLGECPLPPEQCKSHVWGNSCRILRLFLLFGGSLFSELRQMKNGDCYCQTLNCLSGQNIANNPKVIVKIGLQLQKISAKRPISIIFVPQATQDHGTHRGIALFRSHIFLEIFIPLKRCIPVEIPVTQVYSMSQHCTIF